MGSRWDWFCGFAGNDALGLVVLQSQLSQPRLILAPGFFPSKMTKGTLEHFGVDALAAAAPLKRIGDDDDLKGAALLFASAAGKHITGQILAIDGGVSSVNGG